MSLLSQNSVKKKITLKQTQGLERIDVVNDESENGLVNGKRLLIT